MQIKDFITMNIDIDVYDDYTEELAIAFCGPVELTAAGAEHFERALELDVEYTGTVAIVHVNESEDDLSAANEFFVSAAGYCPADDFDRWFKE